ncbi:hypothetical protein M413DRAFT_63016 [Hebeloma cylindrosporum]|uniref:J domain-containing protein n=1 Tax=Hebeloma cylindrosporum TaxID=76867 RepID=A0A0C2Z4B9_HEBCY|nr:hypothetical protein M413DRAFT_63016 [Hebeloma cylindrosporum h7]
MPEFPDYYRLLNVSSSATQDEIRLAYKKETHPDRVVNATPSEIRLSTERFQAVADAYYVLSDTQRRREYDVLYKTRRNRTTDPGASSSFGTPDGTRPNPEGVFADVFDELLRSEVERRVPWWSYFGAVCGAGMGFIIANFPGLMLGAVAGNRLGAIRDAKGKSVAAVFNDLGGQQKAEILRALAMKVLGSAL